MRSRLNEIKWWFEVLWSNILRRLGKKYDSSVIPKGEYCYTYDEEKNKKDPIDGYWIKSCKYYRGVSKRGTTACTFVGTHGFDFLLYDQCKICGENHERNTD